MEAAAQWNFNDSKSMGFWSQSGKTFLTDSISSLASSMNSSTKDGSMASISGTRDQRMRRCLGSLGAFQRDGGLVVEF